MTHPTNRAFRALFLTASIVAAATAAAFAAPSAWLMKATGIVEVTAPSGPIAANPPALLPDGSTVKTGSNGLALIETSDGSKIKLRANSEFAVAKVAADESAFSLLKGAISCWVTRLQGRRFNVHAPSAVASVRGTTFDVASDGKTTQFDLFQGEIQVSDSFGGRMIQTPGQRVTVNIVRGLVGASSLPPGVHAEAEPAAALPPAPKQAAAAPNAKAPPPPPALASEPDVPPAPPAPPAPPPQQQKTVVSPSSP